MAARRLALLALVPRALDNALRSKGRVLAGTVGPVPACTRRHALRAAAVLPGSDRPELLVNLTLPQSASLNATQEVVARVEKLFKADPDIDYWSFYVGQGAIRFYLPLDAQLANDFFAQAVVVTKGFKQRAGVQRAAREGLAAELRQRAEPRQPAGARPAGRLAGQVPRQRPGSDERASWRRVRAGARRERQHAQHQLRLERARQSPSASRSTRTAPARSASARSSSPTTSTRCCRAPPSRSCAIDLPDRHRRPRHPRGARQARDAAQPDAGDVRRAQRAAGADRQASPTGWSRR